MVNVASLTLVGVVIAMWGIPVNGHSRNYCNPQKTLDIIQKVLHREKHNDKTLRAAFSVRSSKAFTSSKAHDTLRFDVVEVNIGNSFHNNVFTCPVSGLYYLSWSYFTNPRRVSDSFLLVNGSIKRITVNNASGANGIYPTAANSIIIRLKKGDRVWLASTGKGYYYREWATFQGWIIQVI